jgi:MATE family multidrug resistance protein
MVIYAGSLWGVGLGGGYLMGFNVLGFTPEFLQGANGILGWQQHQPGTGCLLVTYLFRKTAERYEKRIRLLRFKLN